MIGPRNAYIHIPLFDYIAFIGLIWSKSPFILWFSWSSSDPSFIPFSFIGLIVCQGSFKVIGQRFIGYLVQLFHDHWGFNFIPSEYLFPIGCIKFGKWSCEFMFFCTITFILIRKYIAFTRSIKYIVHIHCIEKRLQSTSFLHKLTFWSIINFLVSQLTKVNSSFYHP